jgi:hypothetical protein
VSRDKVDLPAFSFLEVGIKEIEFQAMPGPEAWFFAAEKNKSKGGRS